jgi:lipid-A-disaccharide synthase-like uncharacterized protein
MGQSECCKEAVIPNVFWGYCVYRTALINILYWWQNDAINPSDAAQYMEAIAKLALEQRDV